MRMHRFLLLAALLLVPALASAAPPASPAPPAVAAVAAPAAVPSLPAFLASLDGTTNTPLPASNCGPNFCTQAQRDACNQSCAGHHLFVGLECCSNCTTLCICGSRPVAC